MLEWTADRWASRLSKIIFTAAMVCAMAFAAAAPDRAFAGGDGGGGHEGGPEPQQIVREGEDKEEENVEDGRDEAEKEKQTEEKKSAKLKKMKKALQKIIDKQTEMKKKLHSPETYDYSAEKFAEDVREEGKMQQELVPLQEEVRELSKELGGPEPT